jgi:anti-sigma factor RsiW
MSLNLLTCDDISPLLDAYHDGELDQAERNSVAAHLGSCGDCQAKLIEIESVVTSLKNLPKLQMARDLSADPEFLKRALELASVPSDSSKEKVGAEIKNFPGNSRKQSEPFVKKLFPVPGPVIFASFAAAAALALVIAVPRYLNNTAATGPSVASLPKQATPKVDENAHSTNAAEGSAQASRMNLRRVKTARVNRLIV